jgi:hypothetical protein
VELERITNNNADEMKDAVVVPQEVTNAPEEEIAVLAEKDPVPEEEPMAEETPTEEIIVPMEKSAGESEVPEEEVVVSVEGRSAVMEEVVDPVEEVSTPMKEAVDPVKEISAQVEKVAAPAEPDRRSKAEIVEQLSVVVEKEASDAVRDEVDVLKQSFYKLRRIETEVEKKAFLEAGGAEENFYATMDPLEEKLKKYLAVFRAKRAALNAITEKIKEQNLLRKRNILEKLQALSESQDDFYKIYNEFRKLQQQWKEIKQVPQNAVNELWKEYQNYSEKFYDLLKINNEMRDYDFRKNLESKQLLCEAVERLEDEKDIIYAFYQLHKLYQEWREIGPVARELREDIWARFKKASSVIHKKYQEHFDALRDQEQSNLEEKTALCVEMEEIDYATIDSFKEWDSQYKLVLERQDKWKTIGQAPKKYNTKLFERFRAACNIFFQRKSEYYKVFRAALDANLEKKIMFCEKAEVLKESQEWKETSEQLTALKKEWKATGAVPRKYSDALWKRFNSAIDYFFEQKNARFHSQKTEESDNLKRKKEIIAQINAIDESLPANETINLMREYMEEFHRTGFVPFHDKEKVYKEFRAAVDHQYDQLHIDENERRLQSFKSNLSDKSGDRSKSRILNERERLMRNYERLKSDIQTYENNFGFLSVSSKSGDGLIKEMQRKIESQKEELLLIEKKIDAIDQNLEA